MTAWLRRWLNSMQAYMIGFAVSVILVLTAVSFTIIEIAGPPKRSSMSIYDISRIVRGLPPALGSLPSQFDPPRIGAPPRRQSEVERALAVILAEELGLPAEAVRISLEIRDAAFIDYIERQVELYREDRHASPIVSGTVTVAIQQPDGKWRILTRRSRYGFENVWQSLRGSPWLGGFLVVPLAMWFGARIARPVKTFAQAAQRVGSGRTTMRVPVAGPNEIQVAAIALNEMQERIRRFVGERTALVGAIAHDLRTPLNSLRFRIAQAPDAVRGPAEKDILQLEQLINSTLEYVESEGRALAIDRIDLASLLQSLVDDQPPGRGKIDLRLAPVEIQGDILLLRRLFANLLDNALTYGSRVTITLCTDVGHAVIELRDNGPGMSDADLQHAFEPFFRGERSRSRSTGGIGVGLAIVRSAAEAHDGEVTLENAQGGGLVARVRLPIEHAAQTASERLDHNTSQGLCQT